MVDFGKLRSQIIKSDVIDPIEIFRRLPKPMGINDLYSSQAEVLSTWYKQRTKPDTVIKLHTGGGKTLVGLLIAKSTLTETGEPVLYLTPNVQLVKQTIEKATAMGIAAVPYERNKPLNDDFVNGKAIMVATYKALFNGKSLFGIRGVGNPQKVSAIILDDAHAAFSVVRDSFTIDVEADKNRILYEELAGLFRRSFKDIDRLGTFDDVLSGSEQAILEVPYWAWHMQLEAVRKLLKANDKEFGLVWPLLRDDLHLCHALISKKSFTITPILPFVNKFPTYFDAPRRIFMSATIEDDSDIIRTFDVATDSAKNVLTSRSLAGVSERMILIPELMPYEFDSRKAAAKLIEFTSKKGLGSIVLVSSDEKADKWSSVATVAKGSADAERYILELQQRTTSGPIVFANRYDGMDLPDDSCRMLVMCGLPAGTSNYELFRASALYGGETINRIMAQRIEQGIGRGSRGAGDYCVVILIGSDLSGWVAKKANFNFLSSATRAQLEMGTQISKEVKKPSDLVAIINQSFERDREWVEYHAETLAELVVSELPDESRFNQAQVERKAVNLWQDGYCEQAIDRIDKYLAKAENLDQQYRGWLEQLSASIADHWGHSKLSEDTQRRAFANNRNLTRPKVLPPYRPLQVQEGQSKAIVKQLGNFRQRRGFLSSFEDTVLALHAYSSANQFEQALCDFAKMIGLLAERHDENGEGPDVLWILPDKTGFVIEAKSRKKEKNALTKEEHGQLLVAAEWFAKSYPNYKCIRVSVHPKNKATKAAVAGASHALTYENLAALIADARSLLTSLCESQLSEPDLLTECDRLLAESDIRFDNISTRYLRPFEEVDD